MCSLLPNVSVLQAACQAFLEECKCPLCAKPWKKASTFPCGHTFCYDCAISTLEGPGISQSECPTCKGKFWKRDLRPNPQWMAVVEHAQKILGLAAGAGARPAAAGCQHSPQLGDVAAAAGAGEERARDWGGAAAVAAQAEGGRASPAGCGFGSQAANLDAAAEGPEHWQSGGGVKSMGPGQLNTLPIEEGRNGPSGSPRFPDQQGSRGGRVPAADVPQADLTPWGSRTGTPAVQALAGRDTHATAAPAPIAHCFGLGLAAGAMAGGNVAGPGGKCEQGGPSLKPLEARGHRPRHGAGPGLSHGPLREVDANQLCAACVNATQRPRPAHVGGSSDVLRAPAAGNGGCEERAAPGSVAERRRSGGQAPTDPGMDDLEARVCTPFSRTAPNSTALSLLAGGDGDGGCTAYTHVAGGDIRGDGQLPVVTAVAEPLPHRGRPSAVPAPPPSQGGVRHAVANVAAVGGGAITGTGARAGTGTGAGPTPCGDSERLLRFTAPPQFHVNMSAATAGTMATPHTQLLPQQLSQPACGWTCPAYNGGPYAGGGVAAGAPRPGSVVSIRRSTPSFNNAYLDFHALLAEAVLCTNQQHQPQGVLCMDAGAEPERPAAAPVVAVEARDAYGEGCDWVEFDEPAWLRRLAGLPGPTEQEREALTFECHVVNMFLEEIEQQIADARSQRAGAGRLCAEAGGIAGGLAATAAAAAVETPVAAARPSGGGLADTGGCKGGVLVAAEIDMAAHGAGTVSTSPRYGSGKGGFAGTAREPYASPLGQPAGGAAEPAEEVRRLCNGADGGRHGRKGTAAAAAVLGRGGLAPTTDRSGDEAVGQAPDLAPVPTLPIRDDAHFRAGLHRRCSLQPPPCDAALSAPALGTAASTPPAVAAAAAAVVAAVVHQPGGGDGQQGRVDDPSAELGASGAAQPRATGFRAAAEQAARGEIASPQQPPCEERDGYGRRKRARIGDGGGRAVRLPCATAASAPAEALGRAVEPIPALWAERAGPSNGPGAGQPCATLERQLLAERDAPGALLPDTREASQVPARRRRGREGQQAAQPVHFPSDLPLSPSAVPTTQRHKQQRQPKKAAHVEPHADAPTSQRTGTRRGRARERLTGAVANAATQPAPSPSAAMAAAVAPTTAGLAAALVPGSAEAAAPGGSARRVRPLHVLSTGLSAAERSTLRELARRMRGVELLEDVAPAMTHLVVNLTPEGRAASRTVKYLRAVVQGCWVVGIKWVEACLAAGQLVPEGPFEATGDTHHEGAPAKSRLRLERGEPPLLSGVSFCVAHLKGHMDGKVHRADVEALLQASGGAIARRPTPRPGASAGPASAAAAIFGLAAIADPYGYDDGERHHHRQPERLPSGAATPEALLAGLLLPSDLPPVVVLVSGPGSADAARVAREWGCAPVLSSWVYDSISHYRLLPVGPYVMAPQPPANAADSSIWH